MASREELTSSFLIRSPDERIIKDDTARRVALWISIFSLIVSALALIGWWQDITFLVRVREGLSSMKPITAIGVGFASLSLAMLACRDRARWMRPVGLASAISAAALSLGLGIEWMAGINPGFESILFPSKIQREAIAVPGRPSYATITAIGLLGVALTAVRMRSRLGLTIAQSLCVILVMLSAVALVGYFTGASALYAFRPYSTMSFYTASTTMILSLGICLAQPDRGLAALVLGLDAGGRVARRLLPICLGVPVLFGFGVLELERIGTVDGRIGLGIALIGTAVLCSMSVIWVARALRQSDTLRAEAERRIDRMMSELDHRVKNTMAIVISLCDLTADGSRSMPEFQEAYRGRLTAMARAHEALAAMRWKGVDLRFIIDAVVVGFAPSRRESLKVRGANMLLPPHVALPMAVTLHELATNALKHGAWNAESIDGLVTLEWNQSESGELLLNWTEKGGTAPAQKPLEGFGLSLIRSMIPHELRGSVKVQFLPQGFECAIRAPIANGRRETARHVA